MPPIRKRLPENPWHDPILSAYMAEVKKIPTASPREEKELLARAKAGDRKAVNALVSSHLRFVVAVCWNYRNLHLPMTDMINEGNLALFKAIDNYRPSGVRFLSYAVWWIRHGILTALARQAGAVSYPPSRMHGIIRFQRAESALSQRLGRSPNLDDLEKATGATRKALASIKSLSAGLASTRGSRAASTAAMQELVSQDEDAGADSAAVRYLLSKAVDKRLAALTPRERQVLSLRYGLGYGVELSLGEVASLLCVSRERVRQIEVKALGFLQRTARSTDAGPARILQGENHERGRIGRAVS